MFANYAVFYTLGSVILNSSNVFVVFIKAYIKIASSLLLRMPKLSGQN